MSLYGDLPQAKDDTGGQPAWAAAAKKLQPLPRKAAGLAPPSVMRSGRGGRGAGPAPVSLPAGRGRGSGASGGGAPITVKAEAAADGPSTSGLGSLASTIAPGPITVTASAPVPSNSLFAVDGQDLAEEYDPSKPNDYEAVARWALSS